MTAYIKLDLNKIPASSIVTQFTSMLQRPVEHKIGFLGIRKVVILLQDTCYIVDLNELAKAFFNTRELDLTRRDVPLLRKMQCFDLWNRLRQLYTESRQYPNTPQAPLKDSASKLCVKHICETMLPSDSSCRAVLEQRSTELGLKKTSGKNLSDKFGPLQAFHFTQQEFEHLWPGQQPQHSFSWYGNRIYIATWNQVHSKLEESSAP